MPTSSRTPTSVSSAHVAPGPRTLMSGEFIGVYVRLLYFASKLSIVFVCSNTHAILSDFTLFTPTFQVGGWWIIVVADVRMRSEHMEKLGEELNKHCVQSGVGI